MIGKSYLNLAGLLVALGASHIPLNAAVSIVSMLPSTASPQPLGTTVTWIVNATNTNAGPLAFQFNVSYSGRPFFLAIDFNRGNLNSGIWTSQPFAWTTIDADGPHQVQVVV